MQTPLPQLRYGRQCDSPRAQLQAAQVLLLCNLVVRLDAWMGSGSSLSCPDPLWLACHISSTGHVGPIEGGVWKPVHSPTELTAGLASGLSDTAPTELRLERALSAGALCSADWSARHGLERALSAGALACSAELAGLMLGGALRAGAVGRTIEVKWPERAIRAVALSPTAGLTGPAQTRQTSQSRCCSSAAYFYGSQASRMLHC